MGDNIGNKYDKGKERWDLLDMSFAKGVVEVLTMGAEKYGANSWQKVDNAKERYFAALMRHIYAWRKGTCKDEESGLSHLLHAACNLMFLYWLDSHGRDEIKDAITKMLDEIGLDSINPACRTCGHRYSGVKGCDDGRVELRNYCGYSWRFDRKHGKKKKEENNG